MFRQAMRSPVIMFHVVPSSMKVQYEQLSHAEQNPPYASGRFSPESLSASTGSSTDRTPSSSLDRTGSGVDRTGSGPDRSGCGLDRTGSGTDRNLHRMSRHGSQTHPHPDHNEGYPPLTHPAVSAAKPPTGHTHSPQRGLNSTPTAGFTKKVGRRLNIQLKKGEFHWSPLK